MKSTFFYSFLLFFFSFFPLFFWGLGSWDPQEPEPELDDDDDVTVEPEAMLRLTAGRDEAVFFCCGDDKLNPVPCFAACRVLPGLVVGFIGNVVHT